MVCKRAGNGLGGFYSRSVLLSPLPDLGGKTDKGRYESFLFRGEWVKEIASIGLFFLGMRIRS